MNTSLEGIDFDVRDFEDASEEIKKLDETLDELIEVLRFELKSL